MYGYSSVFPKKRGARNLTDISPFIYMIKKSIGKFIPVGGDFGGNNPRSEIPLKERFLSLGK